MGEGAKGLFNAVLQIELDRIQIQFPRVNLREIQNVVDDAQQRVGASFHDFKMLAVLSGCGFHG